jgi:hypothetical protein
MIGWFALSILKLGEVLLSDPHSTAVYSDSGASTR